MRGAEIGIVFQSFHLVPTMTAIENVAVPLELAGIADAFDRARAELEARYLAAADRFGAALGERMGAMKVGRGQDDGTEVGQLAGSMNTLLSAVETQFAARLERASGAEVGLRPEGTLIVAGDVTPGMKIKTSGDVVIESRAWRERLFAQRAEPAGGNVAFPHLDPPWNFSGPV